MKRLVTNGSICASTRDRISYLNDRIAEVERQIAECENVEDSEDLQIELYELKDQLRFAWADDEEEYNYALEQQEFNPDGSLKYYDDIYSSYDTQERGTVKTFRNDRNPNKYIEVKKGNDGHSYARQYMEWDTPDGKVKNYTGAKDAKRGRYSRTTRQSIDRMLEDYDEV